MTFTVQGDIAAVIRSVQSRHPSRILPGVNAAWAEKAKKNLQENVGGAAGTRYLRLRSGRTRARVTSSSSASGASVSVTGPGVAIQETGGIILPRNGKYLTFRLYAAGDGATATGPWIRVRRVKIPARHSVRDAALDAFGGLGDYLDSIIGGLAV